MNDKREAQASLFLFSSGRDCRPFLTDSGSQLAQRQLAALLGGIEFQRGLRAPLFMTAERDSSQLGQCLLATLLGGIEFQRGLRAPLFMTAERDSSQLGQCLLTALLGGVEFQRGLWAPLFITARRLRGTHRSWVSASWQRCSAASSSSSTILMSSSCCSSISRLSATSPSMVCSWVRLLLSAS